MSKRFVVNNLFCGSNLKAFFQVTAIDLLTSWFIKVELGCFWYLLSAISLKFELKQ